MNNSQESLVDCVFNALETAKEAISLLPQLPPNVKHVHIKILNAIYHVRDETKTARITDINNFLHFQLPNTTKFINELLNLGYIEKTALPTDKRVVLVNTTELGEQLIKKYIISYRSKLQQEFEKLDQDGCLAMNDTINKIYAIMKIVYEK